MASPLENMDFFDNGNSNNSCLSACFGGPSGVESASQQQTVPMIPVPSRRLTANTAREEMKQTEDFLAAELNKLTVQQRAEALDDVHCVGEELKETPEMIDRSLQEFDQLVQKMQNPAYDLAVNQNRAFVEDPSFRLRFLRCNLYDVHRSVRQMMDFLKHKAMYFGEDKVAREITLDDLDEEDMQLMLSGLYHIQDGRDRTGRVILYVMTEMLGRCRIENLIHVAYYLWNNVMIPMPEVQTKGVVGVYYDVTKPGEKMVMPRLNFMLKMMNVVTSFPLRYSAMHVCLKTGRGNLEMNNALIQYSMKLIPEYARVRTRLHYGTDMEMHYTLRSHGFPTESCPISVVDGAIRLDVLNAWFYKHKASIADQPSYSVLHAAGATRNGSLDDRTLDDNDMDLMDGDFLDDQLEELQTPELPMTLLEPNDVTSSMDVENSTHHATSHVVGSVEPTDNDVLLGRGKGSQLHRGNIRFRTMLEGYRVEYDRTPRKNRRQYSGAVTHFLLGTGVRFLKRRDSGDWEVSSFEEAERRVSQLCVCVSRPSTD